MPDYPALVKITVTGSKTFESVQFTVNDCPSDNLTISTKNLLFGPDANEGSATKSFTASQDVIDHIKDQCSDRIFAERLREELASDTVPEDGNSVSVAIYREDKNLLLSYKNLWIYEESFSSVPQACRAFHLIEDVLKAATDLSGRNYSLRAMV